MFRRHPETLDLVINQLLRRQGLETPLQQRRLIASWPAVAGSAIARYTSQPFIKNQTLFVKVSNPALRQDLSMMRSELVKKLNAQVGSMIITDIHFY